MSETRDRLKSLLHRAVQKAKTEANKLPVLAQAKSVLRDIRNFGAVVPTELLRAEMLRIPSVSSLSVGVSTAGVHIEASFDDAEDVSVRVVPTEVRFAPRGAKEVSFEITPAELARHRHMQELIAAVATAIALSLWAAALRGTHRDAPTAIVDRDTENSFRIDLRTLGIFQKARGGAAVNLLLDALNISAIHPTEGALRLQVQL